MITRHPEKVNKPINAIKKKPSWIRSKLTNSQEFFLTKLKHKKISLTEQIEDLEHNKSLLTTDIDLDYIEILIREKFLFGKKDDKIFLIKE